MKPRLIRTPMVAFLGLATLALVVLILLRPSSPPREATGLEPSDAETSVQHGRPAENVPPPLRSQPPAQSAPPAEPRSDSESEPARSVADLLTSGELLRAAATPEVLEAYRAGHGDDAASLLTSFLATQDRTFLDAAAQRHGHEPRVQLAVLLNDPDPSERTDWLNRFKVSDPSNALPNYLAARENFELGRPLDAIRELAEAVEKDTYEVYTYDAMIDQQELLLSAGLPPVEANAIAMFSTPLPHLAQLRQLGNNVADLQQQYAAAQDTASLDTLTQLGLDLAGRLNQPKGRRFLIDQLVGIAIEDQLLQAYPPNTQLAFMSVPIHVRLADLAAQKQAMRDLAPLVDNAMLQASEATWATYLERVKLQGEWAALQWLQGQLGPR